jgi:hypothetical protein
VTDNVPLRFFVDENLLSLAHRLAEVRIDVAFPGHPLLPEVPLGALDHDWLMEIGRRGLVLITRDKKIRSRPVERAAIYEAGVKGFVLTRAGDMSTQAMVDLVLSKWAAMERFLVDHPEGPWLAAVTRHSIAALRLAGS